MKNVNELKPCPFCGKRAYINIINGSFFIDCFHTKECLVRPSTWLSSDKSIKKQIKKWNKRIEIGEV